jgi:hypothetical protein
VAIRRLSSSSLTTGSKSSKLWDQETTLGTFEAIATATCTAATTSAITFSNIPQNYSHLQIRFVARSTTTNAGESVIISVNDTDQTHYHTHQLYGQGSSIVSVAYATTAPIVTIPSGGNTASTYGAGVVDILDYKSTTKNKTIKMFGGMETNAGSGQSNCWVGLVSGLYSKDTAAVTSVTIGVYVYASGTGFATNSQFSLYGIRGA